MEGEEGGGSENDGRDRAGMGRLCLRKGRVTGCGSLPLNVSFGMLHNLSSSDDNGCEQFGSEVFS